MNSIAHRVTQEKTLRLATITLQMIKAMNVLCRGPSPREHRPNVQEFKMPPRWYLECRIEHLIRMTGNRQGSTGMAVEKFARGSDGFTPPIRELFHHGCRRKAAAVAAVYDRRSSVF
jgi:hypothetical protein